jgi:hypothetical protein
VESRRHIVDRMAYSLADTFQWPLTMTNNVASIIDKCSYFRIAENTS